MQIRYNLLTLVSSLQYHNAMTEFGVFVMDQQTIEALIAYLEGEDADEHLLDDAIDELSFQMPLDWLPQPSIPPAVNAWPGWDDPEKYWWGGDKMKASWKDHDLCHTSLGWIRLHKYHDCGWNQSIDGNQAWSDSSDIFGQGFYQPATGTWVKHAKDTR